MRKVKKLCVMLATALPLLCWEVGYTDENPQQRPLTQAEQQAKTPQDALSRLKTGNMRFVRHELLKADYSKIINESKDAQHPAAIVLACIDSRVPPEIIFDQAVGNIFVARVAASVINDDVLAGMEYATHVAGAKLIVVMGHENCGAVAAACKGIKLGHITQLLGKISPAVAASHVQMPTATCAQADYVNLIAKNNVLSVVKQIPEQSDIIRQEIIDGQVEVVGAMYHVESGDVEFYPG